MEAALPSASDDASVPGRPRRLWGGVVRFSSLVGPPDLPLFFADPLDITISLQFPTREGGGAEAVEMIEYGHEREDL